MSSSKETKKGSPYLEEKSASEKLMDVCFNEN